MTTATRRPPVPATVMKRAGLGYAVPTAENPRLGYTPAEVDALARERVI